MQTSKVEQIICKAVIFLFSTPMEYSPHSERVHRPKQPKHICLYEQEEAPHTTGNIITSVWW